MIFCIKFTIQVIYQEMESEWPIGYMDSFMFNTYRTPGTFDFLRHVKDTLNNLRNSRPSSDRRAIMKMNSMQTAYNLLIFLPEILLLTDFKRTVPKPAYISGYATRVTTPFSHQMNTFPDIFRARLSAYTKTTIPEICII